MINFLFFFFFFNDTATTEIYTLSLHDALPISSGYRRTARSDPSAEPCSSDSSCRRSRSEEHTSELQSRGHLVCRLLLEKKKKKLKNTRYIHAYPPAQTYIPAISSHSPLKPLTS